MITIEEAMKRLKEARFTVQPYQYINEALDTVIKALEQEPCDDAISRQAVIDEIEFFQINPQHFDFVSMIDNIKDLPSVNPQKPKTGYCKDCKWWKDSDGAYRRGIGAESQCPMNRIEVIDGNGYCYMFEPQESEE